jgi:hypothetical protein
MSPHPPGCRAELCDDIAPFRGFGQFHDAPFAGADRNCRLTRQRGDFQTVDASNPNERCAQVAAWLYADLDLSVFFARGGRLMQAHGLIDRDRVKGRQKTHLPCPYPEEDVFKGSGSLDDAAVSSAVSDKAGRYLQVKAPMTRPTTPPDSTAPPTTFVP